MASIRLVLTGGTLSKCYNPLKGALDFDELHMEALLEQANATVDLEVESLYLVDSLDMTEVERSGIVEACLQSEQTRIVITHGTDTMVKTGELLAGSSGLSEKTIVLTGAMVPYRLGGSDALFNMGSALSAVQLLGPGVYLAMNGRIFDAKSVQKNYDLGVFEAL